VELETVNNTFIADFLTIYQTFPSFFRDCICFYAETIQRKFY